MLNLGPVFTTFNVVFGRKATQAVVTLGIKSVTKRNKKLGKALHTGVITLQKLKQSGKLRRM